MSDLVRDKPPEVGIDVIRLWFSLATAVAMVALWMADRPSAVQLLQIPLEWSDDRILTVAPGASFHTFRVAEPHDGEATFRIGGLSHGGEIEVLVNGAPVRALAALRTNGEEYGPADTARVVSRIRRGLNTVTIAERPGVQIVNVAGGTRWYATASGRLGRPVFSVDVANLPKQLPEYPVAVFDTDGKPFFSFSGRFAEYFEPPYASAVSGVSGTTGESEACLTYLLSAPEYRLETPTRLCVRRAPNLDDTTTVVLTVDQKLRATGAVSLRRNLEFLHVELDSNYQSWEEDDATDYFWNREQAVGAADTLPGSRTHFTRVTDFSRRTFAYPATTSGIPELGRSSPRHTDFAGSLNASNTIAGWFSKKGVGSIGLLFERYALSGAAVYPLQGHCGAGGDTHFYVFWEKMFTPFRMMKGDELDVRYSFWLLPSEPQPDAIEDLNETDLFVFGNEREQRAKVVGWLGTADAIGLLRADGSAVLRGLKTARAILPSTERSNRIPPEVYRVKGTAPTAPGRWQSPGSASAVDVHHSWLTVVNFGSAIRSPRRDGDEAVFPDDTAPGSVASPGAGSEPLGVGRPGTAWTADLMRQAPPASVDLVNLTAEFPTEISGVEPAGTYDDNFLEYARVATVSDADYALAINGEVVPAGATSVVTPRVIEWTPTGLAVERTEPTRVSGSFLVRYKFRTTPGTTGVTPRISFQRAAFSAGQRVLVRGVRLERTGGLPGDAASAAATADPISFKLASRTVIDVAGSQVDAAMHHVKYGPFPVEPIYPYRLWIGGELEPARRAAFKAKLVFYTARMTILQMQAIDVSADGAFDHVSDFVAPPGSAGVAVLIEPTDQTFAQGSRLRLSHVTVRSVPFESREPRREKHRP